MHFTQSRPCASYQHVAVMSAHYYNHSLGYSHSDFGVQLLKTMSIANNNLGLHQSGSPLANAALTRDSHPFLTASSLEDNAAVSPMAFQTSVVQTHGQGSFSSRNNEAQPTSEANISTPNSAKQARRGMFSNSTLTPFNGSPSFGQQASHSRRSSLSQQYSENPGLRAGASRSLTDSLYATAVETLGERDGSMLMNGTSVFIEPQSWSESTTVEIARVAPSKPWAKRHLFQSGASKLLGSRGGSISGHVATQEELEVCPVMRFELLGVHGCSVCIAVRAVVVVVPQGH